MLIYNTETGNYTQGARMSDVRSDHCAAAVGTKVYVAGGYDAVYNTLQAVEVYDTEADSWSVGPSLPEPRCVPAACTAATTRGPSHACGHRLGCACCTFSSRWRA